MLRHVIIRFDNLDKKFIVVASHVELGRKSWSEIVSSHDDRESARVNAELVRNIHGAYSAEIVYA